MKLDWDALQDPRIREAIFDLNLEDHFSGIIRLGVNQTYNDLGPENKYAELILGALYLGYGMPKQASEIFLNMLDQGLTSDIQNRLWFYLAKIRFQKALYVDAQTALSQINGRLGGGLEQERTILQTQIWMHQNQYKDAINLLRRFRGQTDWTAYAQFNLSAALNALGRTQDAIFLLKRVAKVPVISAEMHALRDKANLTLGYLYLKDQEPAQAKASLQNIRLDGPLSDKALLGLGWAYSGLNAHKKSLVAWKELAKREKSNPTVLESLLTVPFAYDQLGASKKALREYEKAIEILSSEVKQLNKIIKTVRNGQLMKNILAHDIFGDLNWGKTVNDLRQIPEVVYLIYLFASHEFQEAHKNYREVRFLAEKLQRWMSAMNKYKTISPSFRTAYMDRIVKQQAQVSRVIRELRKYVRRLAINNLETQRKTILRYSKRARFAIAQIYDKAGRGE